jgi:hypothetical protein
LSQQAKFGPFNSDHFKDIGIFNLSGRDRKREWQSLNNLSQGQAMEGFIDLLDSLSGTLRPFVEAIKKDREEKLRKGVEEEKKRKEQEEIDRKRIEQEKRIESENMTNEINKRKLQVKFGYLNGILVEINDLVF